MLVLTHPVITFGQGLKRKYHRRSPSTIKLGYPLKTPAWRPHHLDGRDHYSWLLCLRVFHKKPMPADGSTVVRFNYSWQCYWDGRRRCYWRRKHALGMWGHPLGSRNSAAWSEARRPPVRPVPKTICTSIDSLCLYYQVSLTLTIVKPRFVNLLYSNSSRAFVEGPSDRRPQALDHFGEGTLLAVFVLIILSDLSFHFHCLTCGSR